MKLQFDVQYWYNVFQFVFISIAYLCQKVSHFNFSNSQKLKWWQISLFSLSSITSNPLFQITPSYMYYIIVFSIFLSSRRLPVDGRISRLRKRQPPSVYYWLQTTPVFAQAGKLWIKLQHFAIKILIVFININISD